MHCIVYTISTGTTSLQKGNLRATSKSNPMQNLILFNSKYYDQVMFPCFQSSHLAIQYHTMGKPRPSGPASMNGESNEYLMKHNHPMPFFFFFYFKTKVDPKEPF